LTSTAEAPAWSRPALIAIALLAGALMLSDVTISGFGNTYYATGALAASRSWSALLTNAADLGGYVSLDKGPLSDWMTGLSTRLFGFSSFSVMLPNALCGLASVIVLHDAVRRALGSQIAIVAALLMALTPVAVLVGRYNTPDALLVLLLVCAARSLTIALRSGRMRDLALCGAFVGLAFDTKMLEAYLVLPAVAAALLLGRAATLRRRIGELAATLGMALIVSLSWFTTMMLIPAAERPYVGDSPSNSWFQLILEGNGVDRFLGHGGSFSREAAPGRLLRLFSHHLGGQIGWLLPLAALGLALGVRSSWGSRGEAPTFGSYLLWGAWGLGVYLVLSFSTGVFHAYYTSLLAPPVAVLAAAAIVTLWAAARRSPSAALALAGVLVGLAALAFVLLSYASGFVPWLRWLALASGCAAAGLLTTQAAGRLHGRLACRPTAYTIATVARAHTGYDPIAGPLVRNSPPPSIHHATSAAHTPAAALGLIGSYLRAHRGDTRFLVAATDARTADPIALSTNAPVITIGGFTGADPTPTVAQLRHLIASGRLRYVLLDATRTRVRGESGGSSASAWAAAHCAAISYATMLGGKASSARAQSWSASGLELLACEAATPVGSPSALVDLKKSWRKAP
jgi:4-amino-4-deoxy-L-arabinose transferase-like glycosyltransferase